MKEGALKPRMDFSFSYLCKNIYQGPMGCQVLPTNKSDPHGASILRWGDRHEIRQASQVRGWEVEAVLGLQCQGLGSPVSAEGFPGRQHLSLCPCLRPGHLDSCCRRESGAECLTLSRVLTASWFFPWSAHKTRPQSVSPGLFQAMEGDRGVVSPLEGLRVHESTCHSSRDIVAALRWSWACAPPGTS